MTLDKKVKEGLEKARRIEELDKQLSSVEELEEEDQEFKAAIANLRELIRGKTEENE